MTPALLFREVPAEPVSMRRLFGEESIVFDREYGFLRMVAGLIQESNWASVAVRGNDQRDWRVTGIPIWGAVGLTQSRTIFVRFILARDYIIDLLSAKSNILDFTR